MKKANTLFVTILLFLFIVESSFAEIKLPAIVSSNMVLQRNTTIVLWGWADSNEKINIKTSWLVEPLDLIADANGNWKVEVKTTNSKEKQTIKLKSKTSNILLDNILFGEVWLCSGQSNMQQPINGYSGQPTFGSIEAKLNSKNPNLRLFSVDRIGSRLPIKDVIKYSSWEEASMENVGNFSAIAYFFGERLQKTLDVPVGMIHTSWGGSIVEAWISKSVLERYKNVDIEKLDAVKNGNHTPTSLFNAMINPLIPYTIKGALWYQGESNRKRPEEYTKLFPAMVKDWRTRWGIGNFPFYYVQIAPYIYDKSEPFNTSGNSSFIREAQLKCLDLIPNSGMAVTMDIGDKYSIHPPKKKEVADRLFFNALHNTYALKTIDPSGPVYTTYSVEKDSILLNFKHAEDGVYAYKDLKGFEIAGADRIFYPAKAKIVNRKQVLVFSDEVKAPLAVRYAWKNWIIGTLFDSHELPAPSFRTDDWDNATRYNK